jgi:hypothetical protein
VALTDHGDLEACEVRWFLAWVEFLATPRIRATLRWALGEQGEMGL